MVSCLGGRRVMPFFVSDVGFFGRQHPRNVDTTLGDTSLDLPLLIAFWIFTCFFENPLSKTDG